jgi:hypothetical protein
MPRIFDRARSGAITAGYLFGLTLSTAGSSATLTVASGFAADSTGIHRISLGSSIAKTTSAWAAGPAGGLDTGTIANNTWYHVYAIFNPTTGVSDAVFSATATPLAGPTTLPTGFTTWRRIGAALTNSSAQWVKFVQEGDQFVWDTPFADVGVSNPGSSAVLRTITVPANLRVLADMLIGSQDPGAAGSGGIYVSDPLAADVATSVPSLAFAGIYIAPPPSGNAATGGNARCYTNTSRQIRHRIQISSAGTNVTISTIGWFDTRGQYV